MRKILHSLWLAPRQILACTIGIYQRTLSPDHGVLSVLYPYGFCRHSPTCSAYAKETLLREGILKGAFRIVKRLFSCNPWREPSTERLRMVARKLSR